MACVGEESKVCSGREINCMGQIEFCPFGCPGPLSVHCRVGKLQRSACRKWESRYKSSSQKRVFRNLAKPYAFE